MSFEKIAFHAQIAANLKQLGFETQTLIQRKAIPPAMDGRDIIGLAQTGTGKTAAFVLPLLQNLIPKSRKSVRGLIIAPTRELAEQIHSVIKGLGHHTGVRSTPIYGGVGIGPQTMILRQGVEIVVACPGRLLDHITRRTIDLTHVEYLVLDEADRLFDMGFLPDIRRIVARLPKNRQTLLFSATMPTEIRHLTHEILRDPLTIQVAHTAPLASVSHALYPVSQSLKTPFVLALLKSIDKESVLIFTRTKQRAKRLAEQVSIAGYRVASLQGNLSQRQRQVAMDGFRSGRFQILVATDIAARGIDVSTISHVINYDIPDTVDAYTHRIGRTGRAAKTGDAFTLTTPEDEGMVRDIERVMRCRLERRKLEGFDYNAKPPARHIGGHPHGGHHGGGGRPRQGHHSQGGHAAAHAPAHAGGQSGAHGGGGMHAPRPAGYGQRRNFRPGQGRMFRGFRPPRGGAGRPAGGSAS